MTETVADRARRIVDKLGGRWRGNYGLCLCPSHADRRPSLSIRVGTNAVLYNCWAGCGREEVARALAKIDLHGRELAGSPGEKAARDDERLRELANWLWLKTMPISGTLADRYLAHRALPGVRSGALRFAPSARFGSGHNQTIHPAMVAAVKDDQGITALQRTILDPDTARKAPEESDPRRMLGRPGRGAVRLWPATHIVGLAEGTETAVHASIELGIPTWASLGTKRFAAIDLPSSITELVLLADDDRPGRAAAEAAVDAYRREGLTITTLWPGRGRVDWND